ncbi:hypothetical protein ABHF33_06600 [Chitinibacter sp. FCG-7]|uniref:DUF2809 domain-containing protein n=1 Tax=Chitinibacter mangrovi TaxID=3153927 RepID=A0AAU7FDH7_9NEIS
MSWYLMPWRIATLLIGLLLLVLGADYYQFGDWDYGISVLMALATYALMPRFHAALLQRDWLVAALILVFCVDTTYTAYLQAMAMTLELRWVNFGASASLFGFCWIVWCLLPMLWQGKIRSVLPFKSVRGQA